MRRFYPKRGVGFRIFDLGRTETRRTNPMRCLQKFASARITLLSNGKGLFIHHRDTERFLSEPAWRPLDQRRDLLQR